MKKRISSTNFDIRRPEEQKKKKAKTSKKNSQQTMGGNQCPGLRNE